MSGSLKAKRNQKRDIYVDSTDSSSSESKSKHDHDHSHEHSRSHEHSHSRERSRERSRDRSHDRSHDHDHKHKHCDKHNMCERLSLEPPKNACEEKKVTHHFQVTLGECKVSRDVKVTHCLTANLHHHIKEDVTCKHVPCTKHQSENVHTVRDGKSCDVSFPDDESDIVFVDDWSVKSCDSSSTGHHHHHHHGKKCHKVEKSKNDKQKPQKDDKPKDDKSKDDKSNLKDDAKFLKLI